MKSYFDTEFKTLFWMSISDLNPKPKTLIQIENLKPILPPLLETLNLIWNRDPNLKR